MHVLGGLPLATAHLPSVGSALLGAFVLGIVHGVTPDEHTWPVTFSYAMGSPSARRAMRSALAFSLAFALQSALLSELAYLGLVVVREQAVWNAAVYVVVGAFMIAAAVYMLGVRDRYTLHLHLWPPRISVCGHGHDHGQHAARAPAPAMAAVHGFIAGFGIDAFGVIVATVLAPAMPSATLGWAPGALFGLGTAVVLAGAGALLGALVRRRRFSVHAAERVAQQAAGRTLLIGGAMFSVAGLAGLADPAVMSAGVATGIHVQNLDKLNLGMVLVIGVVLVAATTMLRAVRRLRAAIAQGQAAGAPVGHAAAPHAHAGSVASAGLAAVAPMAAGGEAVAQAEVSGVS